MGRVQSRDTTPELTVRRALHALGYRYTLHGGKLPGKPDLVFPARRLAVFVHGCWWHGHDCARGARVPKSNVAYWRAKIARNVARDRRTLAELRKAGWRAVVVWECSLTPRRRDASLKRLAAFLRAHSASKRP